jgi:MFS superfamily sulfate permease-like transporter
VLDELFGDLLSIFFFDNAESDLIPGFGMFVACLVLPLQFGILVGIGINILLILYHVARPKITIENQQVSLTISAMY